MAGLDEESSQEVVNFYSTFCNEITLVSSPEVAESAKLFENTFRQVNIALVNEFSLICRALGISVHEVLEAANTKPYGFMKFSPGVGVGGHCIPVDPSFLAFAAKKLGADAKFIELANDVNFHRPEAIIAEIAKEMKIEFTGRNVLLVGISYKPNISDVRESPALRLMEILRIQNEVSWFDPIVRSWNGENSVELGRKKFDVTIFCNIHTGTPVSDLINSGDLVIDLTGKIKGVINL
jgi:UDP-N-acetyl-D-glucosamine dehydrogenase